MRVVRRGVEHQVGELQARQVLGLRPVVGKHQAVRRDAALHRFAAQVAFGLLGAQQPQHAARRLRQQIAPDVEDLRRELVGLVEAAQHQALGRQARLCARGRRADGGAAAVRLVAVRHPGQRFAVVGGGTGRRDETVADEVVAEPAAQRAGIAQETHLQRRWPVGEQRGACAGGVALQVDQDVDTVGMDRARRLQVVERRDVVEALERQRQALAHAQAVVGAVAVGMQLEAVEIVGLEHLDHQQRGGVLLEVARQVADADAGVRRHRATGQHGFGCEFRGEQRPVGGARQQAGGHPARRAMLLLRGGDAGQRQQVERRQCRRVGIVQRLQRQRLPRVEVVPLAPGAAAGIAIHRNADRAHGAIHQPLSNRPRTTPAACAAGPPAGPSSAAPGR